MTFEPVALSQALDACKGHALALREALEDLSELDVSLLDLEKLSRADRRLLDPFAYRYTRLQDDIGARLIPSVLRALGEDVARLAFLDRIDRLEQLGWLPSASEWDDWDSPETNAEIARLFYEGDEGEPRRGSEWLAPWHPGNSTGDVMALGVKCSRKALEHPGFAVNCRAALPALPAT